MASLDLSAAFDLVDVKLLIKRLNIIGLPEDLVDLIKVWLENRSFYVSINGANSKILKLKLSGFSFSKSILYSHSYLSHLLGVRYN